MDGVIGERRGILMTRHRTLALSVDTILMKTTFQHLLEIFYVDLLIFIIEIFLSIFQ